MTSINIEKEPDQSLGIRILAFIARVLLAISIPLIAFYVLYQGFLFLRDSDANRAIIALVAIVWGGIDQAVPNYSPLWGLLIAAAGFPVYGVWRRLAQGRAHRPAR